MWTLLAAAADVQDIGWHQLVPSGWNPMASIRGLGPAGQLSDADPRSQEMLEQLRKVWDEAPTVPSLEGRAVRITGYVVPLESGPHGIREFLLVPYFGACIHTPPPPANQIVFVRLQDPVKGVQTMSAVRVSGTLAGDRSNWGVGVSGYQMKAASVEKLPVK